VKENTIVNTKISNDLILNVNNVIVNTDNIPNDLESSSVDNVYNNTHNNLNVLGLNCCGIKNKLQFKMQNRKKVKRVKSGCIILCYKDCLDAFIEPIDTDCKFMLWCKISKRCNIRYNIYTSSIYLILLTITRVTRPLPLVEQELLTISEYISSHPVLVGVRVAQI
jgi:hypothetical protein